MWFGSWVPESRRNVVPVTSGSDTRFTSFPCTSAGYSVRLRTPVYNRGGQLGVLREPHSQEGKVIKSHIVMKRNIC